MDKPTRAVLSESFLRGFLERFLAGDQFACLSAAWCAHGLSAITLKDLLRGSYSTKQAQRAYAALSYERRNVRFAPANFRARLQVQQLLEIRRRVLQQPESQRVQAAKDAAASYLVDLETIQLIVKGRYATIAMREALAVERQAQQCLSGARRGP